MAIVKVLSWTLFALWGVSTGWELYARAPGEQVSIVGQLFFNVGIPYFVLFLILVWVIRTTGLNRLPRLLDVLESRFGGSEIPSEVGKSDGKAE